MSALADRVLDALDEMPFGSVTGEVSFVGRLATVQMVAAAAGCSDSSARRAILDLLDRSLVRVFDVVDVSLRSRRLLITGDA